MLNRDHTAQISPTSNLRPVAILVFASLLPASPVSQVYGLSR
jgi:hypothetical protein